MATTPSLLSVFALAAGVQLARLADAALNLLPNRRVRAGMKHLQPRPSHIPPAPVGIMPSLRDADGIHIPSSRRLHVGSTWVKLSPAGPAIIRNTSGSPIKPCSNWLPLDYRAPSR